MSVTLCVYAHAHMWIYVHTRTHVHAHHPKTKDFLDFEKLYKRCKTIKRINT